MTDKVQKIREEVERLKGWNNNVRNSTRHMTLQEEDFNRGKHSSYLEILNFIDSLQEEPVSEDLEQASKEWLKPQLDKSYESYGDGMMMELTHFDGYAMLDAIEFGAKWQKKQDQSIIELAEDHAMLAGMEKMREQMIKEAVEAKVIPADLDETQFCLSDYDEVSYITAMVKAGKLKLLDKVKLVIVKED